MDDVLSNVEKSIDFNGIKPLDSYVPDSDTGSWYTGYGTTITIILIIVILCLLGLNIFSYLAEGTDYLSWFVQKFTRQLPVAAKDVVDTTLTGVDLGVDAAAGAINDAGDVLARELDLKRTKLWKDRDDNVKGAINSRDIPGINNFPQHEPQHSPNYKESTEDDNIQERKKPGYCYIGTDRGYRSCIKVNKFDDCVSKKIFPTMDVCINPELRQ
jgi:hypothetical protein